MIRGINGGIEDLNQAADHFAKVDGVMMGRAPYRNPKLLNSVDRRIFNSGDTAISMAELCEALCAYSDRHLSAGGKLNQITRHIIGLYQGIPGARRYRHILSTESVKAGAGPEVIRKAFQAVEGTHRLVA